MIDVVFAVLCLWTLPLTPLWLKTHISGIRSRNERYHRVPKFGPMA